LILNLWTETFFPSASHIMTLQTECHRDVCVRML